MMAKLDPSPVKHYPLPAYPPRLDVLADPELLKAHLPPSWLGRKELAGAFRGLTCEAGGSYGRLRLQGRRKFRKLAPGT